MLWILETAYILVALQRMRGAPDMTIEDFLEQSLTCRTVDELGALFVGAIAAAGYQNMTFARVDHEGFIEIPFLHTPEPFVPAYLEAGCARSDAVLRQAAVSSQPFYWADIAATRELSRGEQRTFSVSRDVGVHSGLSIPFHGPGGVIDLIGVSLRDGNTQDRAATGRIVAIASIFRWRYWQLQNEAQAAPAAAAPGQHVGGPPDMTHAHCRALVLIDLAEHRRRIGLTEMSRTLPRYVAEADLAQLLSWGYVVEVPDDNRFVYCYAPSLLGRRHIETCLQAQMTRRRAWSVDVPRHERIENGS